MEAGTQAIGAAAPGVEPLGAARRRWGEELIRALLFLAAAISILTTIGIVVALIEESVSFFDEVGTRFFTDSEWNPLFADPQFGIWQLLNGTFLITGIAILVAIPVGLGSAIYLSEYAAPGVRRVIKPALEVLVGVPTVVFGYFALTFVTPTILQDILGVNVQIFNALAAGLVMGVMIVPTVASLSEDAMSAVPNSMRQGSAALGANRMQTSVRVVFPAALSGIVAAIVLGVSRAVGETMIVAIAAGGQARIVTGPLQQGQTMTGFIANAALGDSRVGSIEYDTLFAVGLLLFAITLLINFISFRFVRRFREAY